MNSKSPQQRENAAQKQLVQKALKNVEQHAFLMKCALDKFSGMDANSSEQGSQEDLMDSVLRHAAEMLRELRTSALSPRHYYELFIAVTAELRVFCMHISDTHASVTENGETLLRLYERVQSCGNVLPRVYLLIAVGSVIINKYSYRLLKSTSITATDEGSDDGRILGRAVSSLYPTMKVMSHNKLPSNDHKTSDTNESAINHFKENIDENDINLGKVMLLDLFDMVKGEQHSTRGLFLRNYLVTSLKEYLLSVGTFDLESGVQQSIHHKHSCQDSIVIALLQNLKESNRLWIRMKHQDPRHRCHSNSFDETSNSVDDDIVNGDAASTESALSLASSFVLNAVITNPKTNEELRRQWHETERWELRLLVGTSLTYLSQLESLDLIMYKEVC